MTKELQKIKGKTAKEWREYIKKAEVSGFEGLLEWCHRIYEAKKAYGGSFREWAEEWYNEYSFSSLKQLAKIGEEKERLVTISNHPQVIHKQVSADWRSIYEITTLNDEEIIELPAINQKEIKKYKKSKEQAQRQKMLKEAILPEGIFQVIYADPPWQYRNTGFEMSASQKYETLTTEEICNYKDDKGRPISKIIAERAVCFLWTTNPLLPDGLKVLKAWGFEYKTNFVWEKERHTAGFYNFGKHELLLLGVRGNKMLPNEKFLSIIEGKNSKHSSKPGKVYEMIEKMYPGLKYIEIFQRNPRKGWAGVGNEI